MNLIARVAQLFSKKDRMSSVSAYRRAGHYFVVTQHGSGGGDPCIEAGPLEVLPLGGPVTELGEAIFRGLARTTHNYPYPANQEKWKQVAAPLLQAAKCKSWASFAKSSSSVRVNQVADKVHVTPSARDAKGSFFPVVERQQHLQGPSAEMLGCLVAAELEYASTRDAA
jgi:hypothetical protein